MEDLNAGFPNEMLFRDGQSVSSGEDGPGEGGEVGTQLGSAHGVSCLGNEKLNYEVTTPESSFTDT